MSLCSEDEMISSVEESAFYAIENVRKNIGNDIPIIWFHGTSNKEFAENIASKIVIYLGFL